jgi:hypothetical protein
MCTYVAEVASRAQNFLVHVRGEPNPAMGGLLYARVSRAASIHHLKCPIGVIRTWKGALIMVTAVLSINPRHAYAYTKPGKPYATRDGII